MENRKIVYQAEYEIRHSIIAKTFKTLAEAMKYLEKIMKDLNCYARVEEVEMIKEEETGMWCPEKLTVILEGGTSGWIDWRNGDPDHDNWGRG